METETPPTDRALRSLVRGGVAAALLLGAWHRGGWRGLVVGAVVVAVLEVMRSRSISHDAACRSCLHLKQDHHGPCQECLRIRQRSEPLGHSPCSRFAR